MIGMVLAIASCETGDERLAEYARQSVEQQARQNETMAPRREFATVRNRLSSFFDEDNYTNVRGLFLFGY